MRIYISRVALLAVASSVIGVATLATTAEPAKKPEAAGPFDERLQAIAKDYQRFNKLDNYARWAPTSCVGPSGPRGPLASASDDQSSHGHKLYYLFVAKRNEYLDVAKKDSPVGQVLVKESYAAEPVSPDEKVTKTSPARAIGKDGKTYQMGHPLGLFVMYKTDPKTKDTDDGWVYGTISENGKVTSAGRLDNCMACHKDATRDHVFGLYGPPEKKGKKSVDE